MASQSGYNDAGSSGQGIWSELRARDLPSKRLLGKGLASIAYETELNGERFARLDFIGVPIGIFLKEAAVLVGLKDHKNVVKTHGRTVDKMSCSLVLEYMEDDLLDLLQKRKEPSQGRMAGTDSSNQSKPFELPEALDIILQIARGMEFLHEQMILHGDLKTKNILVTHMNDGDKDLLAVKVADFGLVRTKRKSMSFVSRQARKLDVVQWKAPEILEILLLEDNDETTSESDSNSDKERTGSPGVTGRLGADVYSFAVTCSQILTGEDPYPNRNWKVLGAKIVSGKLRPKLPAACPPFLKDLLASCWRKDPAERPTFSNIRTTLESLHNPQTEETEAGPPTMMVESVAGNTRAGELVMATMEKASRIVRCSKCFALLQEPPPGTPLYKCGNCSTVLRAKHASADGSGARRASARAPQLNRATPPIHADSNDARKLPSKPMPPDLTSRQPNLDDPDDEEKVTPDQKSIAGQFNETPNGSLPKTINTIGQDLLPPASDVSLVRRIQQKEPGLKATLQHKEKLVVSKDTVNDENDEPGALLGEDEEHSPSTQSTRMSRKPLSRPRFLSSGESAIGGTQPKHMWKSSHAGQPRQESDAPSNLQEFHGLPDVLNYDASEDSSNVDDADPYQITSKPHSDELKSPTQADAAGGNSGRSGDEDEQEPTDTRSPNSQSQDHVGVTSSPFGGPVKPAYFSSHRSPESSTHSEFPTPQTQTSDQLKQEPQPPESTNSFSFGQGGGQIQQVSAYSSLRGQTQKVRLQINTPVPERIHVRCRHCNLQLEVPPNLTRSETGKQKLRCGSCWRISRFRSNYLLLSYTCGASSPAGSDRASPESSFRLGFSDGTTSGRYSGTWSTLSAEPSPTTSLWSTLSSGSQQKTTASPDWRLLQSSSDSDEAEKASTAQLKIEPTTFSYNPTRMTSWSAPETGPEFDDGHKFKGLEGFLKKSVKELTKGKKSTRYRRKVVVNGHAMPDDVVRRAEEYAGGIHPGSYWYDFRAGFWGVMGGPCLGMIPPFIEELNFPLARHCSHGKTGLLVNGRELHDKDLKLLEKRGLPGTPGKAYNVDIDGRVTEETTGIELKGLGRLAPALEQTGRGPGMWVPESQRGYECPRSM